MITAIVVFILWLLLSALAGSIAEKKGRSTNAYFFLSLFLSPVIGIVAALAASESPEGMERNALMTGAVRKCPHCAELVKKGAAICRFCGNELPELPEVSLKTWKGGKII